MKRTIEILSLGFFLTMTFSGCSLGGDNQSENTDQQNISNTDTPVPFFLSLPDDWRTFPSSSYSKNIVFAAQEPSQGDAIDTIITVAQEKGTPFSLEQFVSKSIENTRKYSQDFQELSRSEAVLDSQEKGIIVSFSDRNSLDMSSIGFYALYTISKKNENSTVVTIAYDPNTSDDHKAFLQSILQTYNSSGKPTK